MHRWDRRNGLQRGLFCSLLLFLLLPSYMMTVKAGQVNYAKALDQMGLFHGTGLGYELHRVPTRAEGLVMLLRLLGAEQKIRAVRVEHPFTDAGWAESYIAYAYQEKLIKGVSETQFGREQAMTTQQYCTLLLRALGYSDGENSDFNSQTVDSFAALVFGTQIPEGQFNRENMARLSYLAIQTRKKDSSRTIGQTLVQEGTISAQSLRVAQNICKQPEILPSSTTILVYMIASDLESQQGRATADIQEMMRAQSGSNCRILLESGGTMAYQNDWMTAGETARFVLDIDGPHKISTETNTVPTDPTALTAFIQWGKEYAPADRYVLVLWDHGFGLTGGFGKDESNHGASMPVSVLCQAIRESHTKFDIVVFDACLMGGLETAYGLRDSAYYMIASQDSTPACGLYYTTWIEALSKNPNLSTEQLGRFILDSFTIHAGIESNAPTTLSLLRLDRVETLMRELEVLLAAPGSKAAVKKGIQCASPVGKIDGTFDQFDLLEVLKKSDLSGIVRAQAALYAMVGELRNTVGREDACGLAFYAPRAFPALSQVMKEEMKKLGLPIEYINLICG